MFACLLVFVGKAVEVVATRSYFSKRNSVLFPERYPVSERLVFVKCKMYKCKFNVKHREWLRDRPSQRLMIKCLTIIQIKLEFGNSGEKHLGARKRTNNNLNPHMLPCP